MYLKSVVPLVTVFLIQLQIEMASEATSFRDLVLTQVISSRS